MNLAAKIPNIDVNSKAYDEEEINGLTVYYDILPSKILTKEEVIALYKLIERGNNDAREKLINYNLRLVISISKKYVGCGIELEDLISSGNEGLIIAVNKFDYRLGWSFSTYASYWITQSITRNIADNSRTIRVPVYLHERITKIKAFIGIYYAQNMCAPSIEEISKALNFKPSQVEEAMPLLQSIISLDYTNHENEETAEDSMINLIPNYIDEVETETDKIFYEQVKDIIFNQSNLKPKAKEILAYRYGFIENQKHTLDELSEFYGITRERVRQIEAASLKKLSSNHDLKILNLANHK